MKNYVVSSDKLGFTLAEVLITLAIIGVVAAVTMPVLIQKYKNIVVETRLKKFYTNINQAVMMAEVTYGDKKNWFKDLTGAQLDEDENPIMGTSESEKWFNKYLAPYLNIVKQETLHIPGTNNLNGSFIVYFADGSALAPKNHTTGDWYFFPSNPKKCIEKYGVGTSSGICSFLFQFYPNAPKDWRSAIYLYDKGFEPYVYDWDGTEAGLLSNNNIDPRIYGCNEQAGSYCTALIKYHGWKIPANYPRKVNF